MCGRFSLTAPIDMIRSLFNVGADKAIPPRYNIAPTQPVLAVRQQDSGKRELVALEWGLVPEWAKKRPDKPLINARVETVREKPSFRTAVKRQRCLLPFNGWYEWKTENGVKQPYYIEYKNGLGAFAGIWTVWHGGGGDFWLETTAILTAEASADLSRVHHRKPLVVPCDRFGDWLRPHDPLPKGFLRSIDFVREDQFTTRKVSRRVNNIRFDDVACLSAPEMDALPAQHTLFGDL